MEMEPLPPPPKKKKKMNRGGREGDTLICKAFLRVFSSFFNTDFLVGQYVLPITSGRAPLPSLIL